jgi:hypothetical protein
MEPITDITEPQAPCEKKAAAAAFVRGFLGAGRWVRTTAGIMELIEIYFDVGLFHVIGHRGTPLAVLDDTYILTMTRALLGTLSKVA